MPLRGSSVFESATGGCGSRGSYIRYRPARAAVAWLLGIRDATGGSLRGADTAATGGEATQPHARAADSCGMNLRMDRSPSGCGHAALLTASARRGAAALVLLTTLTAGAGLASGNTCDNAGAAFLLSGTSALTLTNVLITENVARQGAGVWLNSASSFTWSGGGWLNNDPDDVYHGGKSWGLTGSGGGSCVGGSCVTN